MLQAPMRQGTNLKSVPFQAATYLSLVHGAGITQPVIELSFLTSTGADEAAPSNTIWTRIYGGLYLELL
jgi:hypothetical protein